MRGRQYEVTRCVDGRRYRHDPQPDDPDLETDRGQCDECGGKGCERKIRVSYVFPPIPVRAFDWLAYFDGGEPDDEGRMLHGSGPTKEAAIQDLQNRWDEQ